jgi:FHA domain
MEAVAVYLEKAKSNSMLAFSELFPHYFLLKRPKKKTSVGPSPTPEFGFATTQADVDYDPIPEIFQVACIKKKAGNPFPDRLTLGRATNCDVVLRLPFVSKVHAHLMIEPDGNLTLRDNNALKGTAHNYRKLEPGSSREVQPGDMLSFGSLNLELVDAAQFYSILRAL